jgi:predicted protein tyrosine phosphatase
VQWADVILVMERNHRGILLSRFRDVDRHRLFVLEIPDEYQYMDPELIELLRSRAGWHLEQLLAADDDAVAPDEPSQDVGDEEQD